MEPIDRQQVINLVKNGCYYMTWVDRAMFIEELKNLPFAQLKPRTGKWMLGFDNRYMEKYYYCSCCGGRKYEESKPLDCYCSKCGANMEGIKDE